jgi:hypothetical protein
MNIVQQMDPDLGHARVGIGMRRRAVAGWSDECS